MSEKEQQFERIYKETENFERTQFVREIQMQINDNKKKDKKIERLNKRILTLEETIRKANNNVLKDIAMISTHEMVKQEIVQRLIETSKILESGSDKY